MIIKFRRLAHGHGLALPIRANAWATGIDICSADNVQLAPGENSNVSTGFAIEPPAGFEVMVRGRSSLAFRDHVLVHVGTIDQDYRGEVKVAMFNLGEKVIYINRGDRIAQLVLLPVYVAHSMEVEELSETERGDGGFGSTGR